jgi:hypothetical protein
MSSIAGKSYDDGMVRLIPPVPYRLTFGPSEDREPPEPVRREPLRLTGHVPLDEASRDRKLPPID